MFLNSSANIAPMDKTTEIAKEDILDTMFGAGVHFGYSKSRRHPSMRDVIYGAKNRTEIIDLTKTRVFLERAEEFVRTLAGTGRSILFVGTKMPVKEIVKNSAVSLNMPYVNERWVGGTFTNFDEIKKRIARMKELIEKKNAGELDMYTKKERLLLSREEDRLTKLFGGVADMAKLPAALFIVDTSAEKNAVAEAKQMDIPIIALQNSDCDLKDATFSIPGNDASVSSIRFVVERIAEAYKAGRA